MAEDLLALLLVVGFGYSLGRAPYQEWEGFINKYKQRIEHLVYIE